MSDYNSSLPVRTENDGDIKSILVDSLIPAQQLEITADRKAKVEQNRLESLLDSVTVVATDLDIRDLSSATDSVTVVATDLDVRNLTKAQDTVVAVLADENELPYSMLNPLTVAISLDNQGDELNEYTKSSAVASGASVNVDYTVPVGKTLILAQFEGAASGKAKFELAVETGVASGVFATKFVKFTTASDNNCGVELKSAIKVLAGVKVRLIVSNRDLLPQDIYSTISGQLV